MDVKSILKTYYAIEKISVSKDQRFFMGSKSLLIGFKVKEDVIDSKTDDVILKAGKKVTVATAKKLSRLSRSVKIEIDPEGLIGRFLFDEIVDPETGEIEVDFNQEVTENVLEIIKKNKLIFLDNLKHIFRNLSLIHI